MLQGGQGAAVAYGAPEKGRVFCSLLFFFTSCWCLHCNNPGEDFSMDHSALLHGGAVVYLIRLQKSHIYKVRC